ncbi:hypothetical protein [Planctomicrobium sp. SH664]|uniref:hypothetical protein n=1 Tax=Planctomicrobium sp. SH664 TaxID=3448125 RepID=UPI003F5BE069
MGGWISKAVNVFRRDVPEAPQPFEIPCECGQKHSGLRRARHQHLMCKSCGASLFVLPRDIYPPPHTPLRAASKAVLTTRVDEAESVPDVTLLPETLLADDDALEHKSPPRRDLPAPQLTRRQKLRKLQAEKEKQQPVAVSPPVGPPLSEVLAASFNRAAERMWLGFIGFWTPLRSIGFAACLVMAGTGVWMIHQVQLAQARETAKREAAAGLIEIEKKSWISARDHFEKAAVAYDKLSRQDVEALSARQYFYETRALNQLSSASLFEIITATPPSLDEQNLKDWNKNFQARFEGTWLIIDGTVQKTKPQRGEPAAKAFAMKFPWSPVPSAGGVVVRADFPIFAELIGDKPAARAIFAGELDSCQLNPETREWVVRLKPETGFLWTHPETYESLGFETAAGEPESSVQMQLKRQQELLESGR